jgi:hypothetical protein
VNDDAPTEVNDASSPERKARPFVPSEEPQPRLGIAHLMLWMVGSAIVLTAMRGFDQRNLEESSQSILLIFRCLLACVYGIAVAAVFLSVSRRLCGGPRFPTSPGHFLLCFIGVTVLVQLAQYLYVTWNRDREIVALFGTVGAAQFIQSMVTTAVAAWCAMQCHQPRRWLIFFALLASARFLQADTSTICNSMILWDRPAQWLHFIALLGVGVCSQVAIMLDAKMRVPRDWLYWAGVFVWIGSYLASVTFSVTQWFIIF